MKIENLNAMPAPTWSWLKMNSTSLEIDPELAPAGAAAVEVEGAGACRGNDGDLEAALKLADSRFPARRVAAPGDASDRERVDAGNLDQLDVPALSAYQTQAVHLEEKCGPAESFSHGCGSETANYLRSVAQTPVVLKLAPYQKECVTVHINGVDGAISAADIQVIAGEHAELDLIVALDSPVIGAGIVGSLLSVVAAEQARVNVTCVQTLDDSWTALDASGFFLDEGARVHVQHTVLGAGKSVTGLASELWGDTSKISVDTDYLAARDQLRDFNYSIRQLGRKTESNMDANGVLTGASKKVLRGTIDLVHGCRGSEGTERESVLLANKGVDNKTVPVILCDEDDVAGNHGATIGHVRDEQLFYMACRGISAEEAEQLFITAKLENAAITAPDERIRAGIVRLGNKLVSNFEEEIA